MNNLVNNIKHTLESAGFNCVTEDTHWSKVETHMMGGGTISINGQVMQQQGNPVKIEKSFEICYEARVKTVGTDKEDRSLMCLFKVLRDEETIQDLEINIYSDEFEFFENLCKKIYGI